MFDIDFIDDNIIKCKTLHRCQINIGGSIEDFTVSLSFWSKDDYRKQWLEAAERLFEPDARSAFITCMYDPKTANIVNWLPAWRVSSIVILQQQLLFLDSAMLNDMDEEFKALASQFSLENPYAAVSDRLSTHSQECQKTGVCRRPRLGSPLADGVEFCPSEWSVGFYSIEDFIGRRTVDWTK